MAKRQDVLKDLPRLLQTVRRATYGNATVIGAGSGSDLFDVNGLQMALAGGLEKWLL